MTRKQACNEVIRIGRITLRGPLAYQPWLYWIDLKNAIKAFEALDDADDGEDPLNESEQSVIRAAKNWLHRVPPINDKEGWELSGRLLWALASHFGIEHWNKPL